MKGIIMACKPKGSTAKKPAAPGTVAKKPKGKM